jgi:hypothetical protein
LLAAEGLVPPPPLAGVGAAVHGLEGLRAGSAVAEGSAEGAVLRC